MDYAHFRDDFVLPASKLGLKLGLECKVMVYQITAFNLQWKLYKNKCLIILQTGCQVRHYSTGLMLNLFMI